MSLLENKTWQWIVFWTLSFIWGTSFILIKKGLLGLPPDVMGSLRIAFTFIYFLPFAIKRLNKLPKYFKSLLIVGYIGNLFPSLLFAAAESHIPSALAGMINATTPIFTWIIGILLYRAKSGIYTLLGILIGFIGTIGLITDNLNFLQSINIYSALVLVATLLYGINTNELKYKLQELDAISISSLGLFLAGPTAILYLLLKGFPFKYVHNQYFTQSVLAVAILAFFSSFIAIMLFNYFIKFTSAVFAASITYVIPIFALFWGILDGETINWQHLIAMFITITGVYLINKETYKPMNKPEKQLVLKSS